MKLIFLTIIFFFFHVQIANANSNHLIPIPAYDSSGYDQAVFKSLIGNKSSELWMITRPSNQKEYAIVLYEKFQYDNESDFAHRKMIGSEWRLERIEVAHIIWQWKA